jgi:hypothetical protein
MNEQKLQSWKSFDLCEFSEDIKRKNIEDTILLKSIINGSNNFITTEYSQYIENNGLCTTRNETFEYYQLISKETLD